eukprot:2692087-Pyramimonas_sp.AAC.2
MFFHVRAALADSCDGRGWLVHRTVRIGPEVIGRRWLPGRRSGATVTEWETDPPEFVLNVTVVSATVPISGLDVTSCAACHPRTVRVGL